MMMTVRLDVVPRRVSMHEERRGYGAVAGAVYCGSCRHGVAGDGGLPQHLELTLCAGGPQIRGKFRAVVVISAMVDNRKSPADDRQHRCLTGFWYTSDHDRDVPVGQAAVA